MHNVLGYGFVAEKSAGFFPPWTKDSKSARNFRQKIPPQWTIAGVAHSSFWSACYSELIPLERVQSVFYFANQLKSRFWFYYFPFRYSVPHSFVGQNIIPFRFSVSARVEKSV